MATKREVLGYMIGSTCAASLAGQVQAQVRGVSPSAAGLLTRRSESLTGLLEPQKVTVLIANQTGYNAVVGDAPLPSGAALSAFRVSFLNGEHGIQYVAALRAPDGKADISIRDQNTDDPYTSYGVWWTFAGAIGGEAEAIVASGQRIAISIPQGPSGYRLVMGGFNVSSLASSNMFDNGELHFASIQLFATDNPGCSINGVIHTHNGGEPILVKVQYSWIPNAYIDDVTSWGRTVSNQTPPPRGGPGVGRSGGVGNYERRVANGQNGMPLTDRYLLKGFELTFHNGAHPILAMGIHLNGELQGGTGQNAITWQDNNTDDPINWSATYLKMK
jgi:hypothetical protein